MDNSGFTIYHFMNFIFAIYYEIRSKLQMIYIFKFFPKFESKVYICNTLHKM
jgi:hypothetical protein